MKAKTKKLTALVALALGILSTPAIFGQSTTALNALTGTQSAPNQYLGSSNLFDVVFKTSNGTSPTERMRILSGTNGFIGIGTTTPSTTLHVNGQSLWLTGGNSTSLPNNAGAGLRLYYDNASTLGKIQSYTYGTFGTFLNLSLQGVGGNVGIGPWGATNTNLTERLHVDGRIMWGNGASSNTLGYDQGGNIELGAVNGGVNPTGGSPYLDFHFGSTAQDFNARIINSANNRLDFSTGGNPVAMSMVGSSIGIGTTSPTAKLDVNGTANVSGKMGIGTTVPNDLLQVGTGSCNVTMGSLNANSTMNWAWSYMGLNASHTATNTWKLTGNTADNGGSLIWANTQGTIYFSNFNSTGGTDQTKTDQQIWDQRTMSIGWNGGPQVTIGKGLTGGTHTNYTLAVDGIMVTKEVFVFPGDWADYVFNANYKLTPINELGEYINSNKHLPNVPTSDEVKKDGVNVGEMQVIQMQKLEELTLYIVQLQKQIDELKQQKNK